MKKGILIDIVLIVFLGIVGLVYFTFFYKTPQHTTEQTPIHSPAPSEKK